LPPAPRDPPPSCHLLQTSCPRRCWRPPCWSSRRASSDAPGRITPRCPAACAGRRNRCPPARPTSWARALPLPDTPWGPSAAVNPTRTPGPHPGATGARLAGLHRNRARGRAPPAPPPGRSSGAPRAHAPQGRPWAVREGGPRRCGPARQPGGGQAGGRNRAQPPPLPPAPPWEGPRPPLGAGRAWRKGSPEAARGGFGGGVAEESPRAAAALRARGPCDRGRRRGRAAARGSARPGIMHPRGRAERAEGRRAPGACAGHAGSRAHPGVRGGPRRWARAWAASRGRGGAGNARGLATPQPTGRRQPAAPAAAGAASVAAGGRGGWAGARRGAGAWCLRAAHTA
jgi:hypothetical protein